MTQRHRERRESQRKRSSFQVPTNCVGTTNLHFASMERKKLHIPRFARNDNITVIAGAA